MKSGISDLRIARISRKCRRRNISAARRAAKNAGESSLEPPSRSRGYGRPVDYRSRRIINCLQRGTIPRRLIIRPYRTCRRLIDGFDRSVFSEAAERAPANRQLIDRPINHPSSFRTAAPGLFRPLSGIRLHCSRIVPIHRSSCRCLQANRRSADPGSFLSYGFCCAGRREALTALFVVTSSDEPL